jgi:hypothetical protein
LSPPEREEEVLSSTQPNAYTERQDPPFVVVEIPLIEHLNV